MPPSEQLSIGSIDFDTSDEYTWQGQVSLADGEVPISLTVIDGELTDDGYVRVTKLLADIDEISQLSRAAIAYDFRTDETGASQLFLTHHLEEFDREERLEAFGSENAEDIGVDDLVASLQLFAIHVDAEDPDRFASFEYSMSKDLSDYVLMVVVDADGEIVSVDMES